MTRPNAYAHPPADEVAGADHGNRSWVAAAPAELAAAISFLTRLPIRRSTADLDRTGAAGFAVVGLAIGLVGAVPIVVLGARLAWPAAVAALLIAVLISGGLHLDGLADTADALVAPNPDAAERARTDPRAGPAGVAAIVLDMLLGGSVLAVLAARDSRIAAAAFVVALTASRASAPVAGWTTRRWRSEPMTGLGGWFSSRVTMLHVAAALLTTGAVTALAAIGVGAPVALGVGTLAGVGAAAVVGAVIVARRGRLDGDGYGAIVEVTFVSILAGVAVLLPVS